VWVPGLAGLRAQACGMNIVQCCAGLGGMANKTEIMHGWGAWPSETELLQDCAGLAVVAQKNRDYACLHLQCGSPWGHGLAEQRSCRAVQALWGVWPPEIVNVRGSPALGAGLMEILRF
jgi:hypothetical protein